MPDRIDTNAPAPSPLLRTATVAAVVTAAAFGCLLGVRTITSPDLGYHLAYGDRFLDTGQLVDTNEFIYTLPGPGEARPEPGPGCWYDADGRYRFANANWLTQVIMSAVYRAGGETGLGLLQAALAAGIILLALLAMSRSGVPPLWRAAGLILIAVVAQGRFSVRPEVFGYLMLAAQLCVLANGPKSWRGGAVLVALQLLLVNLHSYFMLGLALTGAVLVDRLVRVLWQRFRGGGEDGADLRRGALRLGAVLAGQILLCFANPWTWRLAILPFQTLLFVRAHDIAGGVRAAQGHPWAVIGEFFRPFAPEAFLHVKATYGYCVLLGVAGLGGIAAVWRRRWAWLFIIAGMTFVSLSMRRNIAPAAILITPVALAALCGKGDRLLFRFKKSSLSPLSLIVAVVITLASLGLIGSVVTQHYSYTDRSPWRFGLGISRTLVPVDAADWINTHRPEGRLWSGYTSSSNFHYFVRPHPDMPILTNTWAYPPDVMRDVLAISSGQTPFAHAVRRWNPQCVAIRVDRSSGLLPATLAADPAWAVVHVDAMHAVFLRADGPNADLAAKQALTPATLDVAAFGARLEASDPIPAYATCLGGMTLSRMAWIEPAIKLFERTVELQEDYYEAWDLMGAAYFARGTVRLQTGDARARGDLDRALACFNRALRIAPDYQDAIDHRDRVRQLLRPR
jgi:hypothetical protein